MALASQAARARWLRPLHAYSAFQQASHLWRESTCLWRCTRRQAPSSRVHLKSYKSSVLRPTSARDIDCFMNNAVELFAARDLTHLFSVELAAQGV